jgi:hypothetical protein
MSIEKELFESVTRLAHENADIRPHLLPLLQKHAAYENVYVSVSNLPHTVQTVLKELNYTGRDIRVDATTVLSISSAGGAGKRAFAVVLNLGTGMYESYFGSYGGPSPYSTDKKNPIDFDQGDVPIPSNGVIIKGFSDGSKATYAVLYVNPDNMPLFLPSLPQLSEEEQWALSIVKGIKPGYRREYFLKHHVGEYSAENPVIKGLAKKGFLRVTGAGISITTEGKNVIHPKYYRP